MGNGPRVGCIFKRTSFILFCYLVNERRKWGAAETVLGSCRFVLPSCVSVLWKVFDPPCFSLTFFPVSFDAAPWLLFMGPYSLHVPCKLPCSLLIYQLAQPPSDGSHLSVRPMDWRPAHVRAAFGSSAHLRSDSWSVRRSCATPLASHRALAAGPWWGPVGLERVWASQALYAITSLLVSLGLHLL